MFRDAKEELQRLEAALLAQEAEAQNKPEPLPEEDTPAEPVYRNFSNQYGFSSRKVYNADRTDTDPEELGEDIFHPTRRPSALLVLMACLLVLAALAVMLLWAKTQGGLPL